MSRSDDIVKLRHMLDASEKVVSFIRHRTREDLDKEEILALAIIRLLEVVGEAAKGVSESVKSISPSIPWKQVAGTRDRLIHGYFDVDLDVVWSILISDLPPLIIELRQLLDKDS